VGRLNEGWLLRERASPLKRLKHTSAPAGRARLPPSHGGRGLLREPTQTYGLRTRTVTMCWCRTLCWCRSYRSWRRRDGAQAHGRAEVRDEGHANRGTREERAEIAWWGGHCCHCCTSATQTSSTSLAYLDDECERGTFWEVSAVLSDDQLPQVVSRHPWVGDGRERVCSLRLWMDTCTVSEGRKVGW
jgi:hypothetical protein